MTKCSLKYSNPLPGEVQGVIIKWLVIGKSLSSLGLGFPKSALAREV
jgi:hypothetical protein